MKLFANNGETQNGQYRGNLVRGLVETKREALFGDESIVQARRNAGWGWRTFTPACFSKLLEPHGVIRVE